MKVRLLNKRVKNLLLAVFIVSIAIFSGYLTTPKNKSVDPEHRPGGDNYRNLNLSSSPSPASTRRVVDKYPNENILWYHIYLTTDIMKGGTNQNPKFLIDILQDLFDLPMVEFPQGGATIVIKNIVYNTKDGYPDKGGMKDGVSYRQYNSDFYIAIKGFSLDLTRTYKNEEAEAKLAFVDPKTIPYIENKDYCEVDNDCMIRDSFCGYGSFNKYEYYADVWGCESPPYDLEVLNADGQPIFYDEIYDEKMSCNVRAKYAGVKCANHQCKGTGRTLSCIKN